MDTRDPRSTTAALAATLILALAAGGPAAAGEARCADGQVDVAGHCCWPGQDWGAATRQCVGTPLCPAPLQPLGDECVATCDGGRVSVAGHCCWPGQDWGVTTARCLGTPQCPDGMLPQGDGCAPALQVAPGAVGQFTATCESRANEIGAQVGDRYLVTCPASCGDGVVWGSGTYTDDSTLCTAAIHAGSASRTGGTFLVTFVPGLPSYSSSTRHGVTTTSYGAWSGSFTTSPRR